MESPNLAQLMDLERRGWDALSRSEGGDFYRELMTPDAIMILVNGAILNRSMIASSLNDSPPWASYELADERLVAVGGDAAALVYRARASRKGLADDFAALMCSVYRMIDGEPRLALYQQTKITH